METEGTENDYSYTIVSNIPSGYHSSDLRNYFSQFIESGGFECFHFRHRPEEKLLMSSENPIGEVSASAETKGKRSCCCIVRVKKKKINEFFKMYNRKHWNDKNGEIMTQICYIARVKQPQETPKDNEPKRHTRGEAKTIPTDRENFTLSDFNSLPELHPPDLMPNGNVGTPTMVFMDYIKQCRLPPSIIKKLGLSFPRTRTTKMYGSVPLDYDGDVVAGKDEEGDFNVTTATGHDIVSAEEDVNKAATEKQSRADAINGSSDSDKGRKRRKKKSSKDAETKRRMRLNIEEKMISGKDSSEEDNDSCEEWERHEALYDDPSNQERNKERLFEEEIELKWEKGGSGLVFYTDAQYWHAQEGDFDEQTADDWDVDMSAYYEEGAGDKDARDYLTMRQDKRRREGIEATDRFSAGIAMKKDKKRKTEATKIKMSGIGKFEAHTRGFGRKIMEEQGWTDGEGLGSSIRGMAEALDNDGQLPSDRRGFGYRGEKLVRHVGPAKRKVIISTVYDDPAHTDPTEPLHRRNEPYHLKYRDEVQFLKSQETNKASIEKLPVDEKLPGPS